MFLNIQDQEWTAAAQLRAQVELEEQTRRRRPSYHKERRRLSGLSQCQGQRGQLDDEGEAESRSKSSTFDDKKKNIKIGRFVRLCIRKYSAVVVFVVVTSNDVCV